MKEKRIIVWSKENWRHVRPPGKYSLDTFQSCFDYWCHLRELNNGSEGIILHAHFEIREMIEFAIHNRGIGKIPLEKTTIVSEPLIDNSSFLQYMANCSHAKKFCAGELKNWFDKKYGDKYCLLVGQYMDGLVIQFARVDNPTNDFFREGVYIFETRKYLPDEIRAAIQKANKE
jgi:hypothetical protein